MNRLLIVAVGSPPVKVLKSLRESLALNLEAEVHLADQPMDPQFAYLDSRGQYHSTLMLGRLDQLHQQFSGRILGVTTHDLCIPILTFVFGEAQFPGRAAVVSLHRLRQEYYGLPQDEALLNERAQREALHELGHTFGLEHCPRWDCVMHFSNSVDDIDIKGGDYCTSCRKNIG